MIDFETLGGVGFIGSVLALISLRFEHGRKQLVRLLEESRKEAMAVKKITEKCLSMHQHPDDSGFGTKRTNEDLGTILDRMEQDREARREIDILVKENTRATRDLILTIRQGWEAAGHILPPV
ncbi:hypothetical protein LCGC14_2148810 [marine sediment metagenome]|uniref:Uncharacterized protein n=1 Tax=marine sediment metagenome TaxID=412755 RepID=A0A0F9GSE2_9ZZZZ